MINADCRDNGSPAGLNRLDFSRTFNRTIQHGTFKSEGKE